MTIRFFFRNRESALLIVPDFFVPFLSLQFDLYLMTTIKMKDIISNVVILKRERLLCVKHNNIVGNIEYYAIVCSLIIYLISFIPLSNVVPKSKRVTEFPVDLLLFLLFTVYLFPRAISLYLSAVILFTYIIAKYHDYSPNKVNRYR